MLITILVSCSAFASIELPDTPLQPKNLDRYQILEAIESSSIDTTPSLHRALENALPAPRLIATLSETRVWCSDFLRPLTRPEVTPLSRALHRASARLWPGVASDRTVLSPDPLGYRDSSNLYAFCGGDPVNGRDPRGEGVFGDYLRGMKEAPAAFVGGVRGAVKVGVGAVTDIYDFFYEGVGGVIYEHTGAPAYEAQGHAWQKRRE
ncbi:MAG TPA: hypothetical protein VHE82_06600 [Gemmatimonadaceae bacterium]|nr:hypothetical protein [Gemmatimonadaceae bacterium]